MYLAMILLTMGALPVVSLLFEARFGGGHADWLLLAGKWFVFWAVGVRLLLAGLRQTRDPAFTAAMLNVREPASFIVVQELGFASLSLGVLGLLAILNASWIVPAAVAGGLFLGLAGIKHALKGDRTVKENIAMVSDLWAAAVLAACLIGVALR
jgi:uncharacterized protein DUF6790